MPSAAVVTTSSSASVVSPCGLSGIIATSRSAGRSSSSPVTRIWIPSAPAVMKGSVPPRACVPSARSFPAPPSLSVRYHWLHWPFSRTRINIWVLAESALSPLQDKPVTIKGSTEIGSVKIAALSLGSKEDVPCDCNVARENRFKECPFPIPTFSRPAWATRVGSPCELVRVIFCTGCSRIVVVPVRVIW